MLPPNFEVLTLRNSHSLLPLVESGPVRLRALNVYYDPGMSSGVSFDVPPGLSVLTGLESLQYRMHQGGNVAMDWSRLLPKFSLQSLDFRVAYTKAGGGSAPSVFSAPAMAYLGSCRQLTSLCLSQGSCWEGAALQELAKQLPRLSLLQQLHLYRFSHGKEKAPALRQGADFEADWQACLLAIVKLPALRQLELENCGLGAAAEKLCGATQLTRLWLRGFGVGAESEVALAAALKHLRRGCVYIF